jgi:hypothetical protein
MFENKTRVLLILPEDILERARMMAGRATTALRLTVSLQIVLRALIEEGLKRADDRALLANVENQARAVRRLRSLARRRGNPGPARHPSPLRIADEDEMAGRAGNAGYRTLGKPPSARAGERTGGRKRR